MSQTPDFFSSFSLPYFFTYFLSLLSPGLGLWGEMWNSWWGPSFTRASGSPPSASQVLGLQVCTRVGLDLSFLKFPSYGNIKSSQCFLLFPFFSTVPRLTNFEINSLVLSQCLALYHGKCIEFFSIYFFTVTPSLSLHSANKANIDVLRW